MKQVISTPTHKREIIKCKCFSILNQLNHHISKKDYQHFRLLLNATRAKRIIGFPLRPSFQKVSNIFIVVYSLLDNYPKSLLEVFQSWNLILLLFFNLVLCEF